MRREPTDAEVEEDPQPEGPEERLFRARQSGVVYATFVFGLIFLIVAVVLALR